MRNLDDFRYMWRGEIVRCLSVHDAKLLGAYDWSKGNPKRAVLLIHGFSSTPAVYRLMTHALSHHYDCIRIPTLPGHATCYQDFATVEASEWKAQVEQEMQALLERFEAVDVIGLSLGGLLACHLAKSYPIQTLYLLAPALSIRLPIPILLPLVKGLSRLGFEKLRNKAGNIQGEMHSEIAYRQLPLHAIRTILELIQSFELDPLPCPTHLFLGRHDEVIHSEAVEKALQGDPNVHVHWLEHSAHVLPLDNDLQSILDVICDKPLQQERSSSNVLRKAKRDK